MTRYFIGVACKQHVECGVDGNFAQLCHGKGGPLNRMNPGDWIIYYSPTHLFKEKKPLRQFTALGQVTAGKPYTYAMEDFVPWRRDVQYVPAKSVSIEPMLDSFSFIHNRKQWGLPFRSGFFEIQKSDFMIIATAMGVNVNEE